MPKNRFVAEFNGTEYPDNLTELDVNEYMSKPAKGVSTLSAITTADWVNISDDRVVKIWYYDAAGTRASEQTFTGIVASSKYISQKSVQVQFQDYSLKLARWPLTKDIIKNRFYFNAEGKTIGQLVNMFTTEEMATSGGTAIVAIGTIDNSSTVVSKFDGYYGSRWDMLYTLSQKTNATAYFTNLGVLQMRNARGYSVEVNGSGVGTSNTFTDSSKSWTINAYQGHVLIAPDASYIIASNTATALTVSGTPKSGDYLIADMAKDHGSGTAAGGVWTDGTKSWTVNQWVGYTLLDVSGGYLILSNTATTLTVSGAPTTGVYQIIKGFYMSGGFKNAAFGARQYNGNNIWNDVTVVGSNGVSANYRDLSVTSAFTTQADTRLARHFNSTSDSTMYVESLAGIPNEPGFVLLEAGTPLFSGIAIGKKFGIYYYAGTSGNTLTGVSNWADATTPGWENTGLYPALFTAPTSKVLFLNKIRTSSTTGFASNGNILIGSEVIPYSSKGTDFFLLGDVGSGTGNPGEMYDGTKSWATNQWAGYYLVTKGMKVSTDMDFAIISNTGTVLTVAGTPDSGTYMIVPALTVAGIVAPNYTRPRKSSTPLTSDATQDAVTLNVSSTSGFDASGYLKVGTRTGGVEIISYTGIGATTFTGCSRGALGTTPAYLFSGLYVTQYYSSGIHPVGVRVQQYPSGGVAEAASSIGTHGRRAITFNYPHVLTIENVENISSRLLMNHRWGDQFVETNSYAPKDFHNVVVGEPVQITDSSLDLTRYTNRVSRKRLYQNLVSGEFFVAFSVGTEPKSETDKLIDRIMQIAGLKAPNNQLTDDTPYDLLVLQCGSPAAKLMTTGFDATTDSDIGFVNTNYLWVQGTSAAKYWYNYRAYIAGVAIDANGLFFPMQKDAPDPTGVAGAIYYQTPTAPATTGKLRWYDGTGWADLAGGAATNYWTRDTITGYVYPSNTSDFVLVGDPTAARISITPSTIIATAAAGDIDLYIKTRGAAGNIIFGRSDTVLGSVAAVYSAVDATSDLGTSSYKWKDAYFSGAVSAANAVITGTLSANASVGSAGQLLTSNGASPAYWASNFWTRDSGTGAIYPTTAADFLLIGDPAAGRVTLLPTSLIATAASGDIDFYIKTRGAAGNIIFGRSDTLLGSVAAVRSAVDATSDFGTSSYKWKDGYFSGTINTANAVMTGTLSANGGVGSAGQVLTSNGASPAYWTDAAGGIWSRNAGTGYLYPTTNTDYVLIGDSSAARITITPTTITSTAASGNVDFYIKTRGAGGTIIFGRSDAVGSPLEVRPAASDTSYLGTTDYRWLYSFAQYARFQYIGLEDLTSAGNYYTSFERTNSTTTGCWSHFNPVSDATYDLGKSTGRWSHLYVSYVGTAGTYTDYGYFTRLYCTTQTAGQYITGSAFCEMGLLSDEQRKGIMGGNPRQTDFEQGDVLVWKDGKLVRSFKKADCLVQAVSSTDGQPIVMGAEPIRVIGKVYEGDYLVSAENGCAMAERDLSSEKRFGTVIAQALETSEEETPRLVKAMIRKM